MTEGAFSQRIPARAATALRLLSALMMIIGALWGATGTIAYGAGGAFPVATGNVLLFAGLAVWPWPECNRIAALLVPIAWGWIGLPILAVMWAAVQARRMLAGDESGADRWETLHPRLARVPLWAVACAASLGVAIGLGLSGVDIGFWITGLG